MPNPTESTTAAEGFLHEIRKHEDGTTRRYIVKLKENVPKVAFLTGLLSGGAKITITHEWDIINAVAGEDRCRLSYQVQHLRTLNS